MWLQFLFTLGLSSDFTMVDVFKNGEQGYSCIRIPAMMRTFDNTILAFAQARKLNCDDHGWVDLVLKRSFDNGLTWGALQVVWSDSSPNNHVTLGNSAPVQDRDTKQIMIIFCRNNAQVFISRSTDEGASWSLPQQIPDVVKPQWQWVGTGPPGALQLQSGRLIVPSYHTPFWWDDGLVSHAYIIQSDDHGKTWQIGYQFNSPWLGNECQAAQLASGEVVINMRTWVGWRMITLSSDNAETFDEPELKFDLTQTFGGCQGSTIYHPEADALLFTNPHVPWWDVHRYNVSLHISHDKGNSWSFVKTIWPYAGGYTSMIILPDQSVSMIFERANKTELIQEPQSLTYVKSFWSPNQQN